MAKKTVKGRKKPFEVDRITYHEIGGSTWQASLWINGFSMPVAFLWFHPRRQSIEIGHTFTVVFFRRRGVMKYLFDHLRYRYYDRALLTEDATEEGGRDFLMSYGFQEKRLTPTNPWKYTMKPLGEKDWHASHATFAKIQS